MRSKWVWIALGVVAIALCVGGWKWHDESRFRHELAEADRELASGLNQLGRQRLSALRKQRPASAEVNYQLGLCEEMLGHLQAAEDLWSRIPATSAWAAKAATARARLLINAGRFAPAEALLLTVPRDRGTEASQARNSLQWLYQIQGRTGDARALIQETWAHADDPATVLKKLFLLDQSVFPIDHVRKTLETADRNDDRVWLAEANLAAWTGRLDEAAHWLDRCSERRPHDEAVWLARLRVAQAAGDLSSVNQAASHLTLSRRTRAEVLALRAWLVAQRGDTEAERTILHLLTTEEPGNINAWDRLAELAALAGKASDAIAFRKRKAELNDWRERYKTLLDRDDRATHAHELAALAGRLGRSIEATGWDLIEHDRARSEPLVPAVPVTTVASGQPELLESAIADILVPLKTPLSKRLSRPSAAVPEFRDDAEAAGLRFVHDNGHSRRNPPPTEAMSGGVGLLDFDGDGWLDVYLVQGGSFPPLASAGDQGDRLFRNRRDSTFEDVTESAGIAGFPVGYGHGVTVGDYDNDGRPDLFVTRWQSYALYRNTGDGHFEDATRQAGLAGARDWPTSAAFADLDGDGDLDLYVCHYLLYNPANRRRCVHPEAPGNHECNPIDFPSLPDHVFRNDAGTFVDVTAEWGFVDPNGRGLGVVAAHLDDDDRIDLYVANDMTANYLFRNRGARRFEEMGQIAGAAASADGGFKAGMGVAPGDLDGDGLIDLGVTNYFGESSTFFRNLGQGFFADHSSAINMAAPTRRLLGFGIAFFDADNDGVLDVLSANGHVLDPRPQIPWTMPLQLLRGARGGRLADVSDRAGPPFGPLHLGRGLAIGDLDNDGRLDAVVVAQNEPVIYLHNQTKDRGHFIVLTLEGNKSNRDGVGARLAIRAGERRQVAERYGGGSYQSASDPRVHFGLGDARTVESLEVRWPSGQVDRHVNLAADQFYRLKEGAPAQEMIVLTPERTRGK